MEQKSYDIYRENYLGGLHATLGKRREECTKLRREKMTPEAVAENREEFRRDYINMLGWPLSEYEALKNTPMAVRKTHKGTLEGCEVYAMEFEVLPELWFYGLYFDSGKADAPFLIAQHGGSGTPEVAAEMWGENNYNGLVRRGIRRGARVFAPQLYLWDTDAPRQDLDIRLKQVGGSITAVEVFAIRRALDYFAAENIAREGHIGMMGLSYGGFYSLMTAAADTRIVAAYSSCQFSDRYKYGRIDWIWDGSALQFMDAEIAALVAPRALYLDEADRDEFFEDSYFIRECERTLPYFKAAGAVEKFGYSVFSGVHEFSPEEHGVELIFKNI